MNSEEMNRLLTTKAPRKRKGYSIRAARNSYYVSLHVPGGMKHIGTRRTLAEAEELGREANEAYLAARESK